MRIIQIAQSDSAIKSLRGCLQAVFHALEAEFNVAPLFDRTYLLNVSIEKHDESHPLGESWVQVSHSRDDVHYADEFSTLHVERYFENEFVQNEHGKLVNVQFNWANKAETIAKVLNAVKNI